MFLGQARRLREVDRGALIAAGGTCGFTSEASESLVDELLHDLEAAIAAAAERAKDEGWWRERLELVIARTRERAERLEQEPATRTK
jgi:hypothetical protein